ncbi:alpha-amylase family protein [Bacteroidales bacterium OttesenSCG-928-M06]|nr:alpha-amylase family protein [Bacteroidales bacterium OttesenSCG-928-M06]
MNKEKIVIYQVLPRLFGNENTVLVPDGSKKENGCGKLSAFTDKALAEIKKMGFNHIWYTGLIEHATQTDYTSYGIRKDHPAIVKGKAGSPYAIKDYYDIDPDLADDISNRMAEFESLTKRSHKAGLKVIIDFVPNHVARQYHSDAKPDSVEDLGGGDNVHSAFDINNNFYYIPGQAFSPCFSLDDTKGEEYKEYPAKATGNDCFSPHPSINDWYETIKLNYGVDYFNCHRHHFSPIPETWKKMLEILLFWVNKKIDGFRCDMAEMVPVEFWNWAIGKIKEQYPDVLFIAEVYNPNEYRNYIHTGKFDYLYDKVGLYDTLKRVIHCHQGTHDITHCWQAINDIQPKMLNFLENHDEQRIASNFFAGDPFKALPALVISATMNTNPFMLYFGQELGEPGMDAEGFSGCDGRTTIFDYWSIESVRNWRNSGKYDEEKLTDSQKELRRYYIKILQLCNKSKAIREGKFFDLMYKNFSKESFNTHRHYAYLRYAEDELLLIVANFENKDADIKVYIPSHIWECFGIEKTSLKSAKDLLSNKKYPSELICDADYAVQVKADNAVIIRFQLDK